MFDTELPTHELADRLDQLATELGRPMNTVCASEQANDRSAAALLIATAPTLAREAAAELRRARDEVQRLRSQLRRKDQAQHRVEAACCSATELAQQLLAEATPADGSGLEAVKRLSIQRLPLSVRCQNALAREGVKTVEQLLARSERDLLGMVNLGLRSVFEIRQVLEALGLNLRTR